MTKKIFDGSTAFIFISLLTLSFSISAQTTLTNLIINGGFEEGLTGWSAFWTREPNSGECILDSSDQHSGLKCVKIVHSSELDWGLNYSRRINVKYGDWFEIEGWLKIKGEGDAILCVAIYDEVGNALDWSYGAVQIRNSPNWTHLQNKFFIFQKNAKYIIPRIIGSGKATVWADDISLKQIDPIVKPDENLPPVIKLENRFLSVDFYPSNSIFNVFDKRTKNLWKQSVVNGEVSLIKVKTNRDIIEFNIFHLPTMNSLKGTLRLEDESPEIMFELAGEGKLEKNINYPFPFVSGNGTYLVIPMNEGISYPVDDVSINPMRLIAYGGHGICMGFWGVTDGNSSQMAILETPDDVSIQILRVEGKLAVHPVWESQKGNFGYARRLRYVFLDSGGHVGICKRYRAYTQKIGNFKTLKEKQKENPNVDLLIGAVNIWCWERDAVKMVRDLKQAGIEMILWSNGQPPETLRQLNELGVLTSRYDIYQDVMDPANFKYLRGVHSDWTTEAWDKDIVIDAKGRWVRGWGVKGTNDQWYYCGVLCDKRALDYAQKRIPAELKTHPYKCRFIDTTTASPWRECYNTNHPMTRTESKIYKMRLLEYISKDMKLVCGSETGHEAAVPYLHYFEGMLSLGPYRVPDAGRNIQKIWDDPPEHVVKFQLGHRYRLPLWELVYHDCVVAQWYWGDYNNKLPKLWDKRDLFNLLYGTPPMFMFNRQMWEQNKERFVKSYRTICPTVRRVGYYEMVNHRFLTPDRDVQQTEFANGVKITVNFGDKPFKLSDGKIIEPMGYIIEG